MNTYSIVSHITGKLVFMEIQIYLSLEGGNRMKELKYKI